MLLLLLDLLLAAGLILAIAVFLRVLARVQVLWAFIATNTFAILVGDDTSTESTIGQSGGGFVDLLHEVPGKVLVRDPDPMEWRLVPISPENPAEEKGFIHRYVHIQWKGVFPKLRKNKLRQFRYGVDEEGNTLDKKHRGTYSVVPKVVFTKFVFFSGEENVSIRDVETDGNFRLNFEFNFIFEREYPVRSILRLADANAYLETMTKEVVNQIVGTMKPEAYLGGDGSAEAKQNLTVAVLKVVSESALQAIGLRITEVNLHAVSADAETVKLLELAAKTKRENEKLILDAEAKKQARILANDAEADHVERVILPVAKTPGGPAVRAAEAYENNAHVTTFAPGGNGLGFIIDPRTPEKKTKDPVGFKPNKTEEPTATE